MCVCETNKIDLLGLDDKHSSCLWLLIDDELNWNNEEDHLLKLQAKINTYIYYIEEGEYKLNYSDNIFKAFVIQISFLHKPTAKALDFLTDVSKFIREYRIKKGIQIRFLIDLTGID